MQLELAHPKIGFNRLEALLMVVPLFVLMLTAGFSASANLNAQYTNTYFAFGFSNITFFSWSLLIIPFLLHLFLKQQNKGDLRIVHGHIILSLVLLVAVLFTYQVYTPSTLITENTFIGLPNQRQWLEATSATFSLIILQSFLQLLFIVYSLVKLFP